MGAAFDVNESAWDPDRDSENERLSLIGELDPVRLTHARQLLDPTCRTVSARPLGSRRAELLTGCTFNDLEIFVNRVNALASYDDDFEVEALSAASNELETLLGRRRVLKSESDDATIERMPVADRRRARALQMRIDALRLNRYDPVVVRRRHATASIPMLEAAIDRAVEAGEDAEARRYRRLLTRARVELERCAAVEAAVPDVARGAARA